MIRILVVDDSFVATSHLEWIFSSSNEFQVIGIANSGREAIRMSERLKPDIISLDFNLPDMDGFDVTRQIMSTHPTPIVIVSSMFDRRSVAMTFSTLEAGALAILPMPPTANAPDFAQSRQKLLETFRAMARVKLVRRNFESPPPREKPTPSSTAPSGQLEKSKSKVIVIGASTGGPQAIHEIFNTLPKDISAPVVIVQHITPGFEPGFVNWLTQSTGFPISIAVNNEILQNGLGYLAPNGLHLEINREGRIHLVPGPKEHGVCPSISRLFRSVATSCPGAAIGVLLTGMGKDGAAELKLLRDTGSVTIAQDKESSAIFGMPGEAIKLGGAVHILPVSDIARRLNDLTRSKQS